MCRHKYSIPSQDYYSHIKSGTSVNIPPDLKNDVLSIFSTLPEIFAFHKRYTFPYKFLNQLSLWGLGGALKGGLLLIAPWMLRTLSLKCLTATCCMHAALSYLSWRHVIGRRMQML